MNRQELLKALKTVFPGVDKGSLLLEGTDCIAFDGGWVRSYNDLLSLSYPLKSGLRVAVRAEEFRKVLEKMEGEEVQLSLEKGKNKKKSLVLSDDRTQLTMYGTSEDSYFELYSSMKLENVKFTEAPSEFTKALKLTLFTVCPDPVSGVLTGLYCDGRDVVSTDNYRITCYTMENGFSNDPFLIPGSSATELNKLIGVFDGTLELAIQDEWMHWRLDNTVIMSMRPMGGEYPVDKIFDVLNFDSKSSMKGTFPTGTVKAAERAEILSSEGITGRFGYITVEAEEGFLVVKGKTEVGEIQDKIPWVDGFADFGLSLRINPKFLKEILGVTQGFEYNAEKHFMVFEAENFIHLVSLVGKN